MFFKPPKSLDVAEAALRVTGIALASGSVVFAAQMTSDPARTPQINGMEHFAIYSRPAAQRGPREYPQIDYTPIGSTASGYRDRILSSYQLIEADPNGALIRLPEGRLLRVAPGVPVDGLGSVVSIYQRGGKWTVATPKGLILER